jgi:putative aminopeptidase FrvX
MINHDLLKRATETPSVGTACLPVLNVFAEQLGPGFTCTYVADGFCLFQKHGRDATQLKAVLVAHVDEIGGVTYGKSESGGFITRVWGAEPSLFESADLQAYDYLDDGSSSAYQVSARVEKIGDENRLIIFGDRIKPYRTVFTFKTATEFDGDYIIAKAVDPRVTAYCTIEALKRLDNADVGVVLVMAEECAMDVARKAVTYLARHSADLRLVVNADVPLVSNLGDGRLDTPAIRIFEGRNFIDPSFGIKIADRMTAAGVVSHLSAARSGSQTILFTPLAPTISVALPGEEIHTPKGRMSLTGISRCIDLLTAIVVDQLKHAGQ